MTKNKTNKKSIGTENKRIIGLILGVIFFFIFMWARGEPVDLTEGVQLFGIFGSGVLGCILGGLFE